MDCSHLNHLADDLHETAEGFRWLAGLAGAAGIGLKADDVRTKADALDNASDFVRAIADEFEAAEGDHDDDDE